MCAWRSPLMSKLSLTRKNHGDVVRIRRLDHFRIAHRAPWLDDCAHAGLRCVIDTIAERKEGVAA